LTEHPEPPKSFRLLITRVSFPWYRIHALEHDPIYFGREPRNRFDAPAGEFGVLYVAKDAHGAFVETFGHATGLRYVTLDELEKRTLSLIDSKRPLRLADLRGNGLARMGADAALTSGTNHGLSRRWALAIHDHRSQPDGILYRARHDPKRTCAAIFDGAESELVARSGGTFLRPESRALLGDILDTCGFGLLPAKASTS
jgi:hypothetical protein